MPRRATPADANRLVRYWESFNAEATEDDVREALRASKVVAFEDDAERAFCLLQRFHINERVDIGGGAPLAQLLAGRDATWATQVVLLVPEDAGLPVHAPLALTALRDMIAQEPESATEPMFGVISLLAARAWRVGFHRSARIAETTPGRAIIHHPELRVTADEIAAVLGVL